MPQVGATDGKALIAACTSGRPLCEGALVLSDNCSLYCMYVCMYVCIIYFRLIARSCPQKDCRRPLTLQARVRLQASVCDSDRHCTRIGFYPTTAVLVCECPSTNAPCCLSTSDDIVQGGRTRGPSKSAAVGQKQYKYECQPWTRPNMMHAMFQMTSWR